MAEGTWSMTILGEAISRIIDPHDTLIASHQSIHEDVRALTLQTTAFEGKFEQSIHNRQSGSSTIHYHCPSSIHHSQDFCPPRSLKLDVPWFNGTDPLEGNSRLNNSLIFIIHWIISIITLSSSSIDGRLLDGPSGWTTMVSSLLSMNALVLGDSVPPRNMTTPKDLSLN